MKAYVLFSSSRGNCTYIKEGKEEILIDAGFSAKQISDALAKLGTSLSNLSSIFITHEHTDHIKALNVICRHYCIPIYAPSKSIEYIASTMPFTEDHLVENDGGASVCVGGINVSAFNTPHDSLGSVCFKIESEKGKLGYATDIGHLTSNVKNALLGCENVVIESNYDISMLKNGPYPYSIKQRISGAKGHLSNEDCASFLPTLVSSGTKNIILAHLSENNNKPHIALGECRGALNSKGVVVHAEFGKGDVRLIPAAPDGIVEIM